MKSTREVIERREELAESLKDIEFELEASLSNMENMDLIRKDFGNYSHSMESNPNFVKEKRKLEKKVRKLKVKCDKGFSAYYCKRCKKTCEKPAEIKIFEKRMCTDKDCNCPSSSHVYRQFTLVPTSVKVTTTLRDLKAEYEAHFKLKLACEELEDDLKVTKGKFFTLLLDSTDVRLNAGPDEYLSFMRSRVLEEQAPGYLMRLKTLTELQQMLHAPAFPLITAKTDKFTFPVTQTGNPAKEEISSYVCSGSQVEHPPDATENYHTASKKADVPCQTKDGASNPEQEVSPSYHREENNGELSSSDEEEMEQSNKQSKTTNELVQSIIHKFWSSR